MKAKILMLAMTALLVASCSQNDVTLTVPETDRAIGFKVYTGVQTRGTVMTTDELKKRSEGFGIFAYMSQGGNYGAEGKTSYLYMNNVHATCTTSGESPVWSYSPLKYWPTNTADKVSFFAYAPYNAEGVSFADTDVPESLEGASTDPTIPVLTFELPKSQKDMPDLVVAEAQKNKASSDSEGKVTFALKHVLSRVGMKAKTSKDLAANGQTKVYITGVKITQTEQLYSKAKFSMASSKWDYTDGTVLGEAVAASRVASPTTYTLKSASVTDKGILNLVAAKFADYNKNSIDITTDADKGVSLFPQNEYLFFIPVARDEGTETAGDVKVTISYDIVTKAGDTVAKAVVSSLDEEVSLPASGFKKGTAYMYLFSIGLKEITVTATVDPDWSDPTDTDVPVPDTTV